MIQIYDKRKNVYITVDPITGEIAGESSDRDTNIECLGFLEMAV